MIKKYMLVRMTFLVFTGFTSGWLPLMAGQVVIYGTAAGYAGDTLRFFTFDDLISYTPEILCEVPVQSDGSFHARFEISDVQEIFSNLGLYQGYLFVEPGQTYHIVLPPKKPMEIKDMLNPYFKPESVHLGLRDIDTLELNLLIDRFDRVYEPFFYSHARSVYSEMRNEKLGTFIDSLRKVFSGYGNVFFQDYIEARLITLEVMILSDRERVLKKYTGFATNIRYRNPGYMELFNQVFNRYLGYLKRSPLEKKLTEAILRYNNPDSLNAVINTALGGKYPQLAELVMIKGLYDGIYDGSFPREKLLSLMEKIRDRTSFPGHKKILINLVHKVRFLEPGSNPPDFRLPGLYGQNFSLSDFHGKYVYLNFSSRISYSSLRQFPLLQQLYNKYEEKLFIVTIAPENDPGALKYLKESRNYSWVFLICSPSCSTLTDYGVKVFPSYFLLSPEGKVVLAPAPSPTENFEAVFKKMIE